MECAFPAGIAIGFDLFLWFNLKISSRTKRGCPKIQNFPPCVREPQGEGGRLLDAMGQKREMGSERFEAKKLWKCFFLLKKVKCVSR